MKKAFTCIFFILLAGGLAVSCAKEDEFDSNEFQKGAFDRWMEKYHPDVPLLTGQYEGIYAEWLEKNPDGLKLREGYWFELDYTSRDQNGDIFYTRSRSYARQLFGFWFDYAIHYVPERIQYHPNSMSYIYPEGQIKMLSQMHEGDSVRLYLPPAWGYGYGYYGFTYTTSSHFGFSPTTAKVSPSSGMIIDMRLNRVIKDIDLYEREQVARFAVDSLEITDPADSIALGIYLKKQVRNPEGDSVKLDTSTASVYYTTRFLDGHVIDTNVDSVAKANHIAGSNGPWKVRPNSSGIIPAMRKALIHMLSGEKARFVTVSDQAYGTEGNTDSNKGYVVIPPYTPLQFEIYVESVTYDE